MMTINSRFLGTEGLTQTSANHIANIAKEMYEALEARMESLRLVSRDYTVASTEKTYRVENESSREELTSLEASIKEVAALKGLIAWLREGIKEKAELASEKAEGEYIRDLIKAGRKDLEDPSRDLVCSFDTVLREQSPDVMARYFTLEAKCATLGKLIHPDGCFALKRKAFFESVKNPTTVSGRGRDAEISTLSSSFTAEEVDAEFFALQKTYRSLQAELNKLKADLDAKVADRKGAFIKEYLHREKESRAAREEAILEYSREVKALKIILPQSLRDIYEKVNAVASAK